MPATWYSARDNFIRDEDDIETIKRKEFNMSIVADKKPYFMTYVYPALKKKNNEYRRNNKKKAIRKFWEYKIDNISDLERCDIKDSEAEEHLHFYYKLLPTGTNPCMVNKMCWIFEKEFKRCSMPQPDEEFDYTIMKSGAEYSKYTYKLISDLYLEYKRRSEYLMRDLRMGKIDSEDAWETKATIIRWFQAESARVCSNKDELCDILLDLCYQSEVSKQFAWDMAGNTIIWNLLRNGEYKIHFPVESDDCEEDFIYFGRKFVMKEKTLDEDSETDDYCE